MVFNTEIEVELATRTNTVMVPVCCEYTINNDGRGVYERGSERGVDVGFDYIEIENSTWDQSGFSAQEIAEVVAAIKNNYTVLYREISQQIANAQEDAEIDQYLAEKESNFCD